MKCEDCKWWQLIKEGECHKDPPKVYYHSLHNEFVTKWPEVNSMEEFMCDCGEYVEDIFECDFCGNHHCSACYILAAVEVNGGLNARNTGWNVCYSCAEKPEVQIKILQEAKALAGGQLIRAHKEHQKRVNQLAGIIDDINQEMKKIKTEQKVRSE